MKSVRHVRGVCLFLLLAATGCGLSPIQQAQRKLVGKWDADMSQMANEMLKQKAGGNPLGDALGKMALDMAKPKMEFEFMADGKLSFTGSAMGQSVSRRGTWRVTKVEGNVVTLSGKVENEANETENSITLVDDDTLEMMPPAGAPGQTKMKFRRVKQG